MNEIRNNDHARKDKHAPTKYEHHATCDNFSRTICATVTPLFFASRSMRWATGTGTSATSRRVSPCGLITLGLAITGTLTRVSYTGVIYAGIVPGVLVPRRQ